MKLQQLEALVAVVEHAFGTLDLSRVEAACLPENSASRGLLERTGFVHEGMARGYLQLYWRLFSDSLASRTERAALELAG